MGLVTFDIPDLDTIGSQPATDIVNALTDIQTEINGELDSDNLVNFGVTELPVDTRRWYSYASRVTTNSGIRVARIPVTEDIVSVYIRATVGASNAAADIEVNGTNLITRSSDGAAVYATLPNGSGTTGVGAPVILTEPDGFLDVWLNITPVGVSPSVYVENMVLSIIEYGDF